MQGRGKKDSIAVCAKEDLFDRELSRAFLQSSNDSLSTRTQEMELQFM